MNEVVIENISELLKHVTLPDLVAEEKCENASLLDNEKLRTIEKIVNKKIKSGQKKPNESISESINSPKLAKLASSLGTDNSILLLFVLYNKLFCVNSGQFKTQSSEFIQEINQLLGFSKKSGQLILNLFDLNIPFTDNYKSVYVVNKRQNQLIKASGVDLIPGDIPENEIVHIKYLSELDMLCVIKYKKHRANNSILETFKIVEMGLVKDEDIIIGREIYRVRILKDRIINFQPYQSVFVESTENTPEIILNAETDNIQIKGVSTPLSPINYFEPVFQWIALFDKFGGKKLGIKLELEYYNTYTSKFLIQLISRCKQLRDDGRIIEIYWCFSPDDDEMLEFGHQLQNSFKDKFKYIAMDGNKEVQV